MCNVHTTCQSSQNPMKKPLLLLSSFTGEDAEAGWGKVAQLVCGGLCLSVSKSCALTISVYICGERLD